MPLPTNLPSRPARGDCADPATADRPHGAVAHPDLAVAIFSSRETHRVLRSAVDALVAAARASTTIDVLVNGNPVLADELVLGLRQTHQPTPGVRTRVWHIALGDKAHSWNTYIHQLWPAGEVTCCVDGYVHVRRGALDALANELARQPDALAATGIPTVGRSAKSMGETMKREGGIHGNLFALKRSTMDALRTSGFRLPLGLYRVDATIGAALAFGLDPSRHPWAPLQRIALTTDAIWDLEVKRFWRWSDVRAQLRRRDRQAQGVLENRAVSHWLATCRRPPHRMPDTAAALVQWWALQAPASFDELCRSSRRVARAWQQLREPRDWAAAAQPPACLFDSNGSRHGTGP
jgi:hypothetical protein